MRLLLKSESRSVELSHFYHLLSAYAPSQEMFEDLRLMVIAAVKIARETKETQIVDMDRVDFCLHVHPSGSVYVMACIAAFDCFEVDPSVY